MSCFRLFGPKKPQQASKTPPKRPHAPPRRPPKKAPPLPREGISSSASFNKPHRQPPTNNDNETRNSAQRVPAGPFRNALHDEEDHEEGEEEEEEEGKEECGPKIRHFCPQRLPGKPRKTTRGPRKRPSPSEDGRTRPPLTLDLSSAPFLLKPPLEGFALCRRPPL